MNGELCHYCSKPVPQGQSFYEGRGTQVCLACYQLCKPCQSCGFPARHPQKHPRLGMVCEFCAAEQPPQDQGECHLCTEPIIDGQRHYADHGVKVCLNCFNTAKVRCFTCRFPATGSTLEGQGGVCEFCRPRLVGKQTDLKAILAPLEPFLGAFGHKISLPPSVVFLDWRVVMGMQREDPPRFPVNFLDELVHWVYPLYHLDQKLYAAPGLPPEWFIPLAAGQLAAQNLCRRFGEPHLGKSGGRFHFPKAWVHFLTYYTAVRLGYAEVGKKLLRWPEYYVGPEFEDLVKIEKNRGVKGVIQTGNRRFKELI